MAESQGINENISAKPVAGGGETTQLFVQGAGAFAIILGVAFLILYALGHELLSTWGAFLFMCAVPVQLVVSVLWRCGYPASIAALPQPAKGAALTLMTAGGAMLAALAVFTLVGRSVAPPTPMLLHYSILSIVVTFWMILLMRGWPLNLFLRHPLWLGVGTLATCYSIAYALFRLLFDYSFLIGTHVYVQSLDPRGLLDAWSAISFFVTLGGAILILTLSDMTLVTGLVGKRQPHVVKLVATLVALLMSLVCWVVFVKGVGMDTVVYLVKVPVGFTFGVFLVDNLMQHRLFAGVGQPLRGILLTLLASVYAYLMYYVFAAAGPYLTGMALSSGAPAYTLELWLSSALLSVTFPVIVTMTAYFGFWPVRR